MLLVADGRDGNGLQLQEVGPTLLSSVVGISENSLETSNGFLSLENTLDLFTSCLRAIGEILCAKTYVNNSLF